MRAVVQRVSQASVSVEDAIVGRCGVGFVLLVGVHRNDTSDRAAKLADKIAGLRIFNDAEGKMNLAIAALPPSSDPNILAISNFTVFGDAAKSRRPSFTDSAPYEVARHLFDSLVEELRKRDLRVETGAFGEHMQVTLTNDGPVTIILEV